MKSVVMYTTDFCPYCISAKALLHRRGVAFEEINLARDPDSRRQLTQRTGMSTFPQIVIDGEPLGGYRELAAAAKSGRLADLLAA